MCDYDHSWEPISSHQVITRKAHLCMSCQQAFPKGRLMMVTVGKTDGDIGRTYCCMACQFAYMQPDETPLHLCWGWAEGNDYENGPETWAYIDSCLAKHETPTIAGLESALEKHRQLQAVDE